MYFLAVNFHYIHTEQKYKYSGIYPISKEKLKNQLQELGKNFEYISQQQLLAAINGNSHLPERCCLITFDDGLKCQWENALPVLDGLKIPAIFFVPSLPFVEGKVCLVHKIHYIRANIPADVFFSKIENEYFKITGKVLVFSEHDRRKASEQYRYDSEKEALIKFQLNNLLAPELAEKLINSIFSEIVSDENEFCKYFYLRKNMLIDLAKRSYLGIHSYAHKPLSKLSYEQLEDDILRNLETIEKIIHNYGNIKAISYPYGSTEAVSHEVFTVVSELGLKFGFTMERAFNKSLKKPLQFARVDTNDVPGGKLPCFSCDEKGNIVIIQNRNFREKREIYFSE